MRAGLISLVLAGFLIACGQANHATDQERFQSAQSEVGGLAARGQPAADAPAPPDSQPTDALSSDGRTAQSGEEQNAAPNQPPAPGQQPGNPVLYLAYTYASTLELPADHLIGVMDAHVKACQDAGPRLCQLVGSSREGDPQSAVTGEVSLRAEPQWLHRFMGHLAQDAGAAGGRILSQSTSTEDLTRNIVDTQASLRASKTLRDRLQRLLESRPGRLSDLLDVERELARVQGEIDATQSNLEVMQTRVDMSALTLSYQSAAKSIRSDTMRPLGEAFANFIGIVVQGFAWIVTLIAMLVPFAIIIVPVVWVILRWRARRRARKEAATHPASAA